MYIANPGEFAGVKIALSPLRFRLPMARAGVAGAEALLGVRTPRAADRPGDPVHREIANVHLYGGLSLRFGSR